MIQVRFLSRAQNFGPVLCYNLLTMKNQKGFIIPLLITLIGILVLGGGVYIYELKTSAPISPVVDKPIYTESDPVSKDPKPIVVTPSPKVTPTPTPKPKTTSKNVSIVIGQGSSVSVSPGDKVTFSWSFPNSPDNSAVVIVIDGPDAGRVNQDLQPTGSYIWTVPPMACSADGMNCAGITDSALYSYSTEGTYKVYAKLYSPKGGLGGGMLPSNKDLKIITTSSNSTIVISR